MSIFPTFQTAEDDDPRLDTSGRKEDVDVADIPDEALPKGLRDTLASAKARKDAAN